MYLIPPNGSALHFPNAVRAENVEGCWLLYAADGKDRDWIAAAPDTDWAVSNVAPVDTLLSEPIFGSAEETYSPITWFFGALIIVQFILVVALAYRS